MGHSMTDLRQGHRRERGAIRGHAHKCQSACRQGHCEPPEKHPDVIVVRIVVQDLREDPLVTAIIDGGEHTEGAVIELIGGHIP